MTDPETTSTAPQQGRRERKKALTRASVSAAALDLFLERGFDAVSIRDIAERADVAVATIFAHFSGKETLVFDADSDVEHSLLAAVSGASSLADAIDRLEGWVRERRAADAERRLDPRFAAFQQLVDETPALRASWQRLWRDRRPALADALVAAVRIDPAAARLVAMMLVEGYLGAVEHDETDAEVRLPFAVLRTGLPDRPVT